MRNVKDKEYRKIIDESSGMEEKWNILTPIFIFPIIILFVVFVGSFLPTFGKTVSQSGEPLSVAVTPIEYNLEISGNVWVVISIMTWVMYFLAFIKSKRNKIQAYRWNQLASMLIMFPAYYSMFYGFQFFVPFLLIRIFYWLFFVVSIIYLIWLFLTKRNPNIAINSRIDSKELSTILLVLWGVSVVINLINRGFNHFMGTFLLAAMPIFPPLIIIAFTYVFSGFISALTILNRLDKDQEKYRQEFGYSVKGWYGKKSRQYKESLKNK